MAQKLPSRKIALLSTGLVAFLCWLWLPGSALDRLTFRAVALGFTNPPFSVSGKGNFSQPWRLGSSSFESKIEQKNTPVVVSFGDDAEGFFQTSPPSPVDLAVVFSNFQKHDVKQAACAAVLAWDSPDTIQLEALDRTLGKFDSLLMTAPLSRGAVPELMPAAFRKASISIDRIHGDTSALPIVNHISLHGVILGKENTIAGFQTLDLSEKNNTAIPLLARWEDRVVFAFPLLAALQKQGLSLDNLEIELGSHLKLSPESPSVPLDRFGRTPQPPKFSSEISTHIPVTHLMDATENLFQTHSAWPAILTDERNAAEPAIRQFSRQFLSIATALAADQDTSGKEYSRAPWPIELLILALLFFLLRAIGRNKGFPRLVGFLGATAVIIAAQYIAFGMADSWLPGATALVLLLCIISLSHYFPAPKKAKLILDTEVRPAQTLAEFLKAEKIEKTDTRKPSQDESLSIRQRVAARKKN